MTPELSPDARQARDTLRVLLNPDNPHGVVLGDLLRLIVTELLRVGDVLENIVDQLSYDDDGGWMTRFLPPNIVDVNLPPLPDDPKASPR